jgi:hypothetical protein
MNSSGCLKEKERRTTMWKSPIAVVIQNAQTKTDTATASPLALVAIPKKSAKSDREKQTNAKHDSIRI